MSEFVLVKFSPFAAAKYDCEDFIVMQRAHYQRIITYVKQKLKTDTVHFLFGSIEFYLEDDIRYLVNDLEVIPLTESEAFLLHCASVNAKFGTPIVNNKLIK